MSTGIGPEAECDHVSDASEMPGGKKLIHIASEANSQIDVCLAHPSPYGLLSGLG